jgi:hypothetical protein
MRWTRPSRMLRFAFVLSSVAVISTSSAVTGWRGPTPATPLRKPALPVRIDAATVAADGRSVRIDFVGGAEFDPGNPCSVAYVAEAEVAGDELQIAVYAQEHPLGPEAAANCEAIGYARSLVVALDERFLGTRIRDTAGQVFFLAAPDGLVEITGLPDGWTLRRAENLTESPTGRWMRVYSPLPDPGIEDSSVTLIQAFGGPANTTGGELQPDVVVNGKPATLYLHEPTGEMVMVWQIGEDGVALVGNLRDFTQDEFIQLAESIVSAS